MKNNLFGEILHELLDRLQSHGVRVLSQQDHVVFCAGFVALSWAGWEEKRWLGWQSKNAWLGLEKVDFAEGIFRCEIREGESIRGETWEGTDCHFRFDRSFRRDFQRCYRMLNCEKLTLSCFLGKIRFPTLAVVYQNLQSLSLLSLIKTELDVVVATVVVNMVVVGA
jgi:hypothetical protein